MVAYKEPGFAQRRATATQARDKALQQLKARAPIDPRVQAERIAAAQARASVQAQKREAMQAKKAEALAQKAEIIASLATLPAPTEAERKAARDAKYATRKARKK